jgi:RNA polymerase sigma-70 factor (ECF subfamily)
LKFFSAAVHQQGHVPIGKYAAPAAALPVRLPSVPSFEQIYLDRFHDVSRWARALGGLDADLDDITQEVFLIVERKLSGFDGQNLSAWLYSIVRRQVSDYRRSAWMRRVFRGSSRKDQVEQQPVLIDKGPDPSQMLERREMQRLINQMLNKMSAAQRTAFILFEIEAYSGEEIAVLEGIPLNTVWTRLYHARKRFLELVDEARAEGKLP